MARTILSILILLILSCQNPSDHDGDSGTLRIVCATSSMKIAKTSGATVRADLIVSNSSGDPVSTTALYMNGKTATGTVELKAGTGYRVDVKGYDSSDALTYYGSSSNVTIEAKKTTSVTITLVKAGAATVTLSGIVSGVDGVTVILSGDATDSRAVNNGQAYSFTVEAGKNYTVTPSKTGYAFTPENAVYSNISANRAQNFSASKQKFTLSGTITGADSATVTLSGDASAVQTIKGGDTYSFSIDYGGNYSVTPSRTGYNYTPSAKSFTSVTSDQKQDFAGAKKTFTISGKITGADGVTVTLTGDKSESQTVNNGGTFSFTVEYDGTYTVTVSKTGYTFTPAYKNFVKVTADQSQNFTSSKDTFTLSGTITGADGVTVTLSGDAAGTQTVNNGGSYSFTVAYGGNYTVTPSKTGYTFTPANKAFSNVTANQTQSFTAIKQTHTISGTVTGVDGVTVTLSGDATATQTVNSGGTYSFTVSYGGSYTVTPSKTGYTFTPANKAFSNVTANQTQNFSAAKQTFTISGTVNGADGVTVTLSGDATGTQTVNSGGTYSFTVAYGGNYTVTPSKTGYTFTPTNKTFSSVTSNQTLDFAKQAQMSPTVDVKMVSIPGGTFQMGSNLSGEQLIHTVTLSAFEIGKYEVTQSQYVSVMGYSPAYNYGAGDSYPVYNVNWWDAIKFCNTLSANSGFDKCYNESTGECSFWKNGFRLPTEAEWEYACRAGTTTTYYTGNNESDLAHAGWYSGNSSLQAHPIGQKTPNAWGLYDMLGNVMEWCNDWPAYYLSGSVVTNPTGRQTGSFTDDCKSVRGGGWNYNAEGCRPTMCWGATPDIKGDLGFRVVRSPKWGF